MERKIKVMTKSELETTRVSLQQKMDEINVRIAELRVLDINVIRGEAEKVFADILADYPEVVMDVRNSWWNSLYCLDYSNSICFFVKNQFDNLTKVNCILKDRKDRDKECLQPAVAVPFSDFNDKKDVFNNRIAELFLKDSNLIKRLFDSCEYGTEAKMLEKEFYATAEILFKVKGRLKRIKED